MIVPDVNVWIDALHEDSDSFSHVHPWLEAAISAPEPVGISELAHSAVVRILTNPRVLPSPYPVEEVLSRLDSIRAAPGTTVVRPGQRHWQIFTGLCRATKARGNRVPDAYHAALAIEHGATLISSDRGMAVYPGLDWRLPG